MRETIFYRDSILKRNLHPGNTNLLYVYFIIQVFIIYFIHT